MLSGFVTNASNAVILSNTPSQHEYEVVVTIQVIFDEVL
jgi:hypothetical protein